MVAALAVDAVMLTAMLTRIAEFGFSPNKIAALGLNLVLLVHLGSGLAQRRVPARARHVRGARALADAVPAGLRRLGGVVVVAFPPVFGFA